MNEFHTHESEPVTYEVVDDLLATIGEPTHIYVSGPMRGFDGSNFPAFFAVERVLQERWPEADIFNPGREDVERFGLHSQLDEDPTGLLAGRYLSESVTFGDTELRQALGEDLAYITGKADLLVMLPGWQASRGATAESSTASALGTTIVEWETLAAALTAESLGTDTGETPFGATEGVSDRRVTISDLFEGPEAEQRALDRAEQRERESWIADRILAADTPDQMPGYAYEETRMTSATGGEKGAKLAAFDQIDPGILWELAEHFGRGARKYAAHNFRRGYPWSLSFSALCRHLWEFWGGKEWDVCDEHCNRPAPIGESEHGPTCYNHTGSRVIIAVIWHAMALAEFSRYPQFKEYDDRYVHTSH